MFLFGTTLLEICKWVYYNNLYTWYSIGKNWSKLIVPFQNGVHFLFFVYQTVLLWSYQLGWSKLIFKYENSRQDGIFLSIGPRIHGEVEVLLSSLFMSTSYDFKREERLKSFKNSKLTWKNWINLLILQNLRLILPFTFS